jgi:hypothetical protein
VEAIGDQRLPAGTTPGRRTLSVIAAVGQAEREGIADAKREQVAA